MARQTYAQMRDEVLRRLGRTGDTTTQTRIEHWIDACHREICQTWFHPELCVEPAATEALGAGSDNFALPADCYLVFGVRLKSGATLKGRLGYLRPIDLFGRASGTAALPQRYTRYKSKIYVEVPADAAYTAEIFYYRRPIEAAFGGSNTSEVDELFDEPLIEWATAKGQGSLWRPDLAAMGMQSLAAFWQRVANPPLAGGAQRDRDAGDVMDVPYAEALG